MNSFLLAAIFIASIGSIYGQTNTTQEKALCYSGSTLYQQITHNCNEEDSSYTGVWYCSKIEVCEANISPNRECIITRGCATEAQCTNNGVPYNNYLIESPTMQLPAGMTMKATCCQAHNFPNDDTVAIDYSDICNTAATTKIQSLGVVMLVVLAISAFFAQH